MEDEGLREVVFVSLLEALSRPDRVAFTLPSGTTVHGYSVGLDGLLEVDATFPTPETP